MGLVVPSVARVASMAPNQGGTPDAPGGCPVAAMPVPGLTRPAGQGPRPVCCRRNQPASGSARWMSPRPPRAPRHGSQRRHTPRRFRWAWPMAIASRRRAQECPPRAAVISTHQGHRRARPLCRTDVTADEDRDGPGGFESMATPHRSATRGICTAAHHGCRGRGRPRSAPTASPGSPASRPPLPAPHCPIRTARH